MLDPARWVGSLIDEREAAYSTFDSILYALSLGFGAAPMDPRQLRYVYEAHIETLPTLPLVLGYPGLFIREATRELAWDQILHAEEALEIHQPLPPAGVVRDRTYIDAIVDRGPTRGAFVYTRKELHSENDGLPLATIRSAILCRGDGGGGSGGARTIEVTPVPTRAPDVVDTIATLPQQALLYRLCGDSNRIHADPDAAARAGFERPLLHGRCTLGHAAHLLLRHCCAYDGRELQSLSVRFAAPFFPGETLRVALWKDWRRVQFEASSVERDVVVLSHGLAELRS